MIRTRREMLEVIFEDERLSDVYLGWSEEQRLEEFLSLVLGQQVKILKVIPNESARIADESSLVVMEDHSIANVEVQKMGYRFPGQRSACYSADLLLRQYKRVKGERGKGFSYRDIQKVYTVVLYEKSPGEFKNFPDDYIHHFSQSSDTGLAVNLLQEYCFITLDIFLGIVQNKGIRNKLEAWLLFFSTDDPGEMEMLLESYPEFRALYEEIYELCRNVEKVMEMFSKELKELDRNTVQYMIDEMQEQIDGMKRELSDKDTILDKRDQEIARLKQQLKELQDTSRK
ncbi:PD-(D/E)XK nuclease family transposase [Lachnoclostridium phocaeense]|uniref:PD-(D/E)XK nuclease family transposase n=1 Tax=Lachnoclostridium phocaeense TaxID=1871021 RepID=UPI00248EB87C|nr:PD-(D/E)XK nuclease family transposase [Lachnoclostridium phocaeense]